MVTRFSSTSVKLGEKSLEELLAFFSNTKRLRDCLLGEIPTVLRKRRSVESAFFLRENIENVSSHKAEISTSEIDSKRPFFSKGKLHLHLPSAILGRTRSFTDFYHSEAQIVAQTAGTPKNHFESHLHDSFGEFHLVRTWSVSIA